MGCVWGTFGGYVDGYLGYVVKFLMVRIMENCEQQHVQKNDNLFKNKLKDFKTY